MGPILNVHLQAYTSSLDGTIRLWDLDDGACVKTIQVGRAVYHLVSSETELIIQH